MAEFKEVLRQWGRMCGAMGVHERTKCPLVNALDIPNCGSCYDYALDDCENTEKIVMQWAAEHPEPVYPTWLEWLKSMGVIPYMMGLYTIRDEDGTFDDGRVNITENALKEIPADIAEKLGIKPKEPEHEK